jgi:hypothetical protein
MSDDGLQPGDYPFDPRSHKEILKELWVRESDEPDPDWLQGETDSYCQVQRYSYEEHRQFVVLPFYENNVVAAGKERYMLWGRALSDRTLYPIPHEWYVMYLVHDSRDGGSRRDYQWVCRTREAGAVLRLNRLSVEFLPEGGIRAEHYPLGVVSPEPDAWVQEEGISSGTLFYPDRGLWSSDRVNMLEPNLRRRVPISIDAIAWEGGIFAPVELKHSRGWQGLEIQGASTLNWDRHGEGCSPGPARDQQASDPRVSWSAQLDGRKVDLEWAEPCSEDAEASGSSGGGH